MAKVESLSQSEVDYKSIAKKLLTGEAMSEMEKDSILGIAVEFASKLVDEKAGSSRWLTDMSQEVRSHMDTIVLDRVTSLYQSGSTKMFDDLKEKVCESLVIKKDAVTDERFYTILSSGLDMYFDKEISPEVGRCMDFIRESVERIITPNI